VRSVLTRGAFLGWGVVRHQLSDFETARFADVVFKAIQGWEEPQLLPIHPNKTGLFCSPRWCHMGPVGMATRTKSGQSHLSRGPAPATPLPHRARAHRADRRGLEGDGLLRLPKQTERAGICEISARFLLGTWLALAAE